MLVNTKKKLASFEYKESPCQDRKQGKVDQLNSTVWHARCGIVLRTDSSREQCIEIIDIRVVD